jgi:pimeloyl-ACP methyl ester carboxylesterase
MQQKYVTTERLAQGYVIILPGIEGYSYWNRSVVNGLIDAGVPYAMEIYDWTWTRNIPLINLRFGRHHRSESDVIARKIADYRKEHPDAPCYLIGHSGGGAMTLFSLAKLAGEVKATGGILLGPAISPGYDLQPALANTTRGVWHFPSIFDLLFLGVGTTVFGTIDGCHRFSAGAFGFRGLQQAPEDLGDKPVFREIPFRLEMVRCLNLGGHFGYVNRRFVAQWLAPIVMGGDVPRRALKGIVPCQPVEQTPTPAAPASPPA